MPKNKTGKYKIGEIVWVVWGKHISASQKTPNAIRKAYIILKCMVTHVGVTDTDDFVYNFKELGGSYTGEFMEEKKLLSSRKEAEKIITEKIRLDKAKLKELLELEKKVEDCAKDVKDLENKRQEYIRSRKGLLLRHLVVLSLFTLVWALIFKFTNIKFTI